MRSILRDVLSGTDIPPQPDLDTATQDVLAIIRGIVDAAGERGEQDHDRLIARVRRAVNGYLGGSA